MIQFTSKVKLHSVHSLIYLLCFSTVVVGALLPTSTEAPDHLHPEQLWFLGVSALSQYVTARSEGRSSSSA